MQLLYTVYSGYGRSFVVVSLLCLFALCSSFSSLFLSLSQRYPLQVLESEECLDNARCPQSPYWLYIFGLG